MKSLIVGLGNPGAEYEGTRHNIGFAVCDALAQQAEAPWTTERLGQVARLRHKGRHFVLLKPNTFMNLSGRAVRYWLDHEKLDAEQLLIVVDDLALPFGKIRLRAKGSPGGHNGLTDIDAKLGSGAYPRLRLGIGNDYAQGRQIDYVLGRFSQAEQADLGDFLERACKATLAFGTIGLQRTMNEHNG